MNDDVIFRFSPIAICTPVATRPVHWAPLDAMLRFLIALFATPTVLMQKGIATRTIAHATLSQLREAEALARRLLLRDAQAIAATLTSPSKQRSKRRTDNRATPAFTADYRAWRVAFRSSRSNRSAVTKARRIRLKAAEIAFLHMMEPCDPNAGARDDVDPPPARLNACALAARYEALRRVIENPAPFAKRLAWRLRKLEERSSAARVLSALDEGEERGDEPRRLAPNNTS